MSIQKETNSFNGSSFSISHIIEMLEFSSKTTITKQYNKCKSELNSKIKGIILFYGTPGEINNNNFEDLWMKL
jgi:hypothetical protein